MLTQAAGNGGIASVLLVYALLMSDAYAYAEQTI